MKSGRVCRPPARAWPMEAHPGVSEPWGCDRVYTDAVVVAVESASLSDPRCPVARVEIALDLEPAGVEDGLALDGRAGGEIVHLLHRGEHRAAFDVEQA